MIVPAVFFVFFIATGVICFLKNRPLKLLNPPFVNKSAKNRYFYPEKSGCFVEKKQQPRQPSVPAASYTWQIT